MIVPGDRDRLLVASWGDGPTPPNCRIRNARHRGHAVQGSLGGRAGGPSRRRDDHLDDPSGNTLEVLPRRRARHRRVVSPYGHGSSPRNRAWATSSSPPATTPNPPTSTAMCWASNCAIRMRLPPLVGRPRTGRRPGCGSSGSTRATTAWPIMPGETPSGIVHLMMEVERPTTSGLCLDRAYRRKVPMSSHPRRHVNDKMLSFYMKTPGDSDVEFGCEGLEVDDTDWIAREHRGQPVGPRLLHRVLVGARRRSGSRAHGLRRRRPARIPQCARPVLHGITIITTVHEEVPVGFACPVVLLRCRSTRRWCCSVPPRHPGPGPRSRPAGGSASTSCTRTSRRSSVSVRFT